MRVNNITNNINFKENTLSVKMNSENAILMLRDPKAMVKFQQNQDFAKKADSIDSNPIVALGYKLYRTFNMIKNNERSSAEMSQLNTVA
jgi:hypothetical protein